MLYLLLKTDGESLVLFNYLSASEIWPDKNGDLYKKWSTLLK
jgi:hypothetical protein